MKSADPTTILFSLLALIAVVTIAPHAFAVTFTDANDPHGPMASMVWVAGMTIAGVMSGIGVFTAVKRGKLH